MENAVKENNDKISKEQPDKLTVIDNIPQSLDIKHQSNSEITIPKTYNPNESMVLFKIARGLFQSGLFPNAKNEYGAFSIVQYGRELGVPPMMSLKNINIIGGQLACNGQLMLSLAMANGVSYEIIEETKQGASIKFTRGNKTYEAIFTIDEAREAGLLNKDNWKKYPQDMLFWRAVAKGLRRIAPDIIMGLYTTDEVSSGTVIDIETTQIDPLAEEKNKTQKENYEKVNSLPENITKGLEEIEHKSVKEKWQFCNDRNWNNSIIFKAINDIKKQKAQAGQKNGKNQTKKDLESARQFWADFTLDMKKYVKYIKWTEEQLAEFCEDFEWDMPKIDVEITRLANIPPELDPNQNQKDLPL